MTHRLFFAKIIQLARKPELCLAFLLGTTIFVSLILLWMSNTSFKASQLANTSALIFILLFISLLYHRRIPNISISARLVAWFLAITVVYQFPIYAIARISKTTRDSWIIIADQALGFNIRGIQIWLLDNPAVGNLNNFVYQLLSPLLAITVLILSFAGYHKSVFMFALNLIFSAMLGLALFAVAPTVGPTTYLQLPPPTFEPSFRAVYELIRNAPYYVIDLKYSEGLINFPSFHTILACLCAFYGAQIRKLKFLYITIASLIVTATTLSMAHYLTDVLAGLLVSLVSIAFTQYLSDKFLAWGEISDKPWRRLSELGVFIPGFLVRNVR